MSRAGALHRWHPLTSPSLREGPLLSGLMRFHPGPALLLALVAAACTRNAPGSGPGGVTVERQLRVDGALRTYRLHVPAHYDTIRQAPLVLVLHGHGDSAEDFEQSTGMSDKADREGFLVAYPQAAGDPSDWHTGVDGPSAHDDIDFARLLIRTLERSYRVDPRRVFVAGHSNGGIMAYRLASVLADRIAAVGVTAGTIGMIAASGDTVRMAFPSAPVAVIQFHGRADTSVPYDGGPESDGPDDVVSVANTIRFWATADRCPAIPPVRTISADRNVIVDHYGPCAAGTAVVLYTIANAGHRWPGDDVPWWTFPPAAITAVDATDVMWDFFAAHPKLTLPAHRRLFAF